MVFIKIKVFAIVLSCLYIISLFQTTVFSATPRTTTQIIEDSSNNNSIYNIWNGELSSAFSLSCDWLINQNKGDLLYLTLGSAGKSSTDVSYYINEVSLKNNFSSLLDLSYTILNVTFCGYSATNILGKNLISEFESFNNIDSQSIDSLCYSLIAINSNPYKLDDNKNFNVDLCIEKILSFQSDDGGFRLSKNSTESDVIPTAMALIALSSYKTDEKVMNSIKLGLDYIDTNQGKYGDFYSNGKESSIALSYVIIALCSLGISVDTPEFNPTSENLAQLLLHKYNNIDGSFSDELNGEENLFATQLAILALSGVKNNKCPFKLDSPLVINQTEISENVSTTDDKIDTTSLIFTKKNIILSVIISLIAVILISLIIIKKVNKKNNKQE